VEDMPEYKEKAEEFKKKEEETADFYSYGKAWNKPYRDLSGKDIEYDTRREN